MTKIELIEKTLPDIEYLCNELAEKIAEKALELKLLEASLTTIRAFETELRSQLSENPPV